MSRVIRMLVAATAVGGLALSGLMTAGAASASINGRSAHGPGSRYAGPGTGFHAVGLATAPANSRDFAGYAAAVPAGSATVMTASFTVPTLSCTTADRAITPGTAVYYPGLVVNGTETDFTTSPFAAGDVVDVTTKVSTNRTRVQVTDVTTGVTQKIIGAGARAQVVLISDNSWTTSTGRWHVPDFGKLTFKNCLIDGKALASWHPRAYQRVNSNGTVQIRTGGFWPGGTAFTTHFMHS